MNVAVADTCAFVVARAEKCHIAGMNVRCWIGRDIVKSALAALCGRLCVRIAVKNGVVFVAVALVGPFIAMRIVRRNIGRHIKATVPAQALASEWA